MPLALLLTGLTLTSVGIQGTQATLTGLLASDLTGAGSFWYYIAGIFAVGSLGYYPPTQGVSRLLIVLIILVLLLSNEGFWVALQNGIKTPTAAAAPPATPTPQPNLVGASSGASALTSGLTSVVNGLNSLTGQKTPANPLGF